MECRDVAQLLPEYLDASLADRRSGEIEEHLARCETCSAFVDQIREVAAAAKLLRPPVEKAGAPGRILRLYERWKNKRPSWM